MSTKAIAFLLSIFLLVSLSCNLISGTQSTSEPTPEPIVAVEEEPPTPDLQATEDAQSTADAQAEHEAQLSATAAQETQAASEAQEAAAQETQAALEEQAAATQEAEEAASATQAVLAVQTEQANNMFGLIEELYEEGAVAATTGNYYHLDDFDESWAQLGWFSFWDTEYSANNFVITVDAWWDSASDKANWPQSGCGFVFGETDKGDYNYTWLGLDGWGYIVRFMNDNHEALAIKKYGNLDVPGEAKITLAVYDKRITMFVNSKEVYSAYDGIYSPGKISLTLMSGTNAGFGTRCKMENIGLWIFE